MTYQSTTTLTEVPVYTPPTLPPPLLPMPIITPTPEITTTPATPTNHRVDSLDSVPSPDKQISPNSSTVQVQQTSPNNTTTRTASTQGSPAIHKTPSKENAENNKMFKEIHEYEKSIEVYKRNVEPILSAKSVQFETLFKEYISELSNVIKQQTFTSTLEADIIQEEMKKFEQAKQLLWNISSQNAGGAKALEKQIDSRKNIIFMEKRIIKVQSVWRGALVRRNYQRRLKREFHRNKIANEILETERVYVKNLELMVNLYYLPLKDIANSTTPSFISIKEVNAIFSNIELILNVNKQLLTSLEDRIAVHWSKSQKIGDVFLRLAPFVSYYNNILV